MYSTRARRSFSGMDLPEGIGGAGAPPGADASTHHLILLHEKGSRLAGEIRCLVGGNPDRSCLERETMPDLRYRFLACAVLVASVPDRDVHPCLKPRPELGVILVIGPQGSQEDHLPAAAAVDALPRDVLSILGGEGPRPRSVEVFDGRAPALLVPIRLELPDVDEGASLAHVPVAHERLGRVLRIEGKHQGRRIPGGNKAR